MNGDYVGSPIDETIARLFNIARDNQGRFIWSDEVDLDLDYNRPKDVRDDV